MSDISRRQFVKFSLCVAGAAALPRLALARAPVKTLSLYHLHTAERMNVAYYENGRYIPSAMQALNHLLRDWRTGEAHHVDPALFDQLYALQQMVETPGPYHVICGYRSPKTNQMLHANSGGVANRSLHLKGCAIDIRLPGKDLSLLHKAALDMKAGGVGYYPDSDFIHIDTGKARHWG